MLCLLFGLASSAGAAAQDTASPNPENTIALSQQLLAKGQPDECYDSIGSPNNTYPAGPTCADGLTPKVNQGYLWGLAKSGKNIWIGTAANPLCQIVGTIGAAAAFIIPSFTIPPYQTESYVCEFDQSNFRAQHPELNIPPPLGDWRPPQIYQYNLKTAQLTNRTPQDDALINSTVGLRSGGAFKGVAFLAGPNFGIGVQFATGVNMFAFDASNGTFLGEHTFSEYSDIRQWIVAGGALYTGVQLSADGSGAVLRWRGNKKNPFNFDVVGNLDLEAANIALHLGHLAVTTWPVPTSTGNPFAKKMGLWMSPRLGAHGLNSSDAGKWQEIWTIDDYEADPVTATAYNGGALASWKGTLYWGTITVPFEGALAHFAAYGQGSGTLPPNDGIAQTLLGTIRPTSVFRCCHWKKPKGDPPPNAELLYGFNQMPVYNPITGWSMQPNNMGMDAKFGPAGFGNPFNAYSWTMGVYKRQLYIGTFDASYLFFDALTQLESLGIADLESQPDVVDGLPNPFSADSLSQFFQQYLFGADLWTFLSPDHPAVYESLNGVDNYLNYGIRTMIADGTGLYLGTANPMNLKTDPQDAMGGWELLKLTNH